MHLNDQSLALASLRHPSLARYVNCDFPFQQVAVLNTSHFGTEQPVPCDLRTTSRTNQYNVEETVQTRLAKQIVARGWQALSVRRGHPLVGSGHSLAPRLASRACSLDMFKAGKMCETASQGLAHRLHFVMVS